MKNRFIGILLTVFLSQLIPVTVWASGAAYLKNHPLAASTSASYVEGRVLLKLRSGARLNSLTSNLDVLAGSATDDYRIRRFKALSSKVGQTLLRLDYPGVPTEKLLRSLEGHPDVEVAEPDYIISIDAMPNDTEFNELWALNNTGQVVDEVPSTPDADIDAPEAWDQLGGRDAEVVVAVLDTGVDYTHADLAANMWTNELELNGEAGVDDDDNGYVDDIYGIDPCNEDSDPYDDHYHGTHVAGTIAAVTDNGAGIAGITWNRAKIMALKFLSAKGRGYTSDAVICIDYLLAMNQREENDIVVMNASWGSTSPSEAMKTALEAAAAEGIIMSAAAGNSARDCEGEQKHYPSSLDVENVISVAASDQDDNLAYFSNYGASEVDIAAPGVNILSPVPGGGYRALKTDPFYDSMERGDINWDMDLTTGDWAITDEKVADGKMAWSDSPYGNYKQGSAEDDEHLEYNLVSKAIDLSDETETDLMVGFFLYKDLHPYTCEHGCGDKLFVEVSGDDGENWTTLSAHAGSDPNWKSYGYAIPASLVTDKFRIRFRMEVVPHGVADGVYIDKIGIGKANEMGAFAFKNGTSMAAPHVSGVLALMASLYPSESMDQRISMLYSGGDRLDSLKGLVATDRRINLNGALNPYLHITPLIKKVEVVEAVDEDDSVNTLRIEGVFFGETPGKVMFHESYTTDKGVNGNILSWSDTEVVVEKPPYSGGYFYIVDYGGTRSGRRPMKTSLWKTGSPTNTKRDSATSVLLKGKVYTFGGYMDGNSTLRGWEVYDPTTDSWEYPHGNWMVKNRAHLTSAVSNDKVYLIGGYHVGTQSVLDLVTVFEPAEVLKNSSFTKIKPYPTPICFAQAASVDGVIYVSGGLDGDDVPTDNVYSFNPSENEWKLEAKLSQARFAHGTVALNGKVYIFGGLESWEDGEVFTASGQIYDPATGSLSEMADMPVAMGRFGATSDDRFIYVVGGTSNDFWYTPIDAVLRYDTVTNTWSSLADRQLLHAKVATTAVFVPDVGIFSPNGGNLEGRWFKSVKENAFLDIQYITDTDADVIPDTHDNCRLTANKTQLDTDADGYGNRCDCDLNNDNVVNQRDFMKFRSSWGSDDALADFDEDGEVDKEDFEILRSRWGSSAPFE
ncbi:MAG: hypothetical protein CSB34_02205 [Desulfobulbus propionicus]|nr:MAG: hypothetical protein CSB34_02205 [Desulfobulbus propionicus]